MRELVLDGVGDGVDAAEEGAHRAAFLLHDLELRRGLAVVEVVVLAHLTMKFSIGCLRCQVSGVRSQVSGLRCQVSGGVRSQVSGLRSQRKR